MITMVKDEAYNSFKDFNVLAYRSVSYLMQDEMIWKLLKYLTPDAPFKANLTQEEKAALIYNGEEDMTKYRVFLDVGQSDVWTREDVILRVSPYMAVGKNRTVGIITMSFEVYCYYKVNHLNDYTTRVDTMVQRVLEVMNGARVPDVGQLYFDALRDMGDKVFQTGQIPFKGKHILMSANSG